MRRTILILLLGIALCFGFSACHSESEPNPEVSRQQLAAMEDDRLILLLLEQYAVYTEPAVLSAEMSWSYRSGDTVIASMTGEIRSTGVDRKMSLTRTAQGKTVAESYIYSNGVCYFNQGEKKKATAESGEVASYFRKRYPSFGAVADYGFTGKELLRGDDGSYSLVLFAPANGIPASADILSPLSLAPTGTAGNSGEGGESVEMTDFSDIYLTLIFSSEGKLLGQTLGFDCKMISDGVETEGTGILKFRIRSTDPIQPPIPTPDDAESYKEAKDNPFQAPSEE